FWIKGRQFGGKESAKGKIAIVTGANCGIGKQIVRILNEKGAKVYLACRSLENGQKAMAQLAAVGCQIDRLILLEVDLCSFASVRNFVDQFKERETKLDILVNNAGIMFYPKF
uniref:Uncharacterized protein n=1 Tax=Romanomermis culicivorax TaxID=13658 RepID=A0A915L4G9_ROMCU